MEIKPHLETFCFSLAKSSGIIHMMSKQRQRWMVRKKILKEKRNSISCRHIDETGHVKDKKRSLSYLDVFFFSVTPAFFPISLDLILCHTKLRQSRENVKIEMKSKKINKGMERKQNQKTKQVPRPAIKKKKQSVEERRQIQ